MFLKNKNIIFKIRGSKVTDYAALTCIADVLTDEINLTIFSLNYMFIFQKL